MTFDSSPVVSSNPPEWVTVAEWWWFPMMMDRRRRELSKGLHLVARAVLDHLSDDASAVDFCAISGYEHAHLAAHCGLPLRQVLWGVRELSARGLIRFVPSQYYDRAYDYDLLFARDLYEEHQAALQKRELLSRGPEGLSLAAELRFCQPPWAWPPLPSPMGPRSKLLKPGW